ncbi:MAG: hypothetical protein PHS45_04090, partial [Bacilli bacterium]|nr:hypothetical protein [Bacilli bacterium]
MVYINKENLNKFKNLNLNSTYIVTDFDRTITNAYSNSSWALLSKSSLVNKDYIEDRDKLFNYYHPIEIDNTLSYSYKNAMMIEWWQKHIGLLIKYNITEDMVRDIASKPDLINFREGALELLTTLNDMNIPVIIISAGIGNFIKMFLELNNCLYDNILIISNYILFKDNKAIGIEHNIIHALNKYEVASLDIVKEFIGNRDIPIVLGDNIADVFMVPSNQRENALKIGFLEEKVTE